MTAKGFALLTCCLLAAAPVYAAPAKPTAKIAANPASKPKAPVKKAASASAPKEAPRESSGFTGDSGNFAGGVSAKGGLVYMTVPDLPPLTLDIYQPKAAKARPAIVFVHGGGWASGDARHSRSFSDLPDALAALAAKGFVVASVNYRLSGQAKFPAPLQDVKSALRWLRSHADDYGIDATRIMVWGEDAGGHLAALAATSCGVTAFEPAAASTNSATRLPSDCADGAIIWSGFADLAAISDAPTQAALAFLMGCTSTDCAPGVMTAASPVSYINNMTPPFLIQHGETDGIAPTSQARDLADRLKAAGVPVELAIYPGGHELNGAAAMGKLVDFVSRIFPENSKADKKAAAKPKKKS